MYQKSAPETIQAMLASIAQNYVNQILFLHLGFIKSGTNRLIELFSHTKCLLDLCAGTGEIAFGFLKKQHSEAILLDFCAEMLAIAQKKGSPFNDHFEIIQGDAQSIPPTDASVDGVSHFSRYPQRPGT